MNLTELHLNAIPPEMLIAAAAGAAGLVLLLAIVSMLSGRRARLRAEAEIGRAHV